MNNGHFQSFTSARDKTTIACSLTAYAYKDSREIGCGPLRPRQLAIRQRFTPVGKIATNTFGTGVGSTYYLMHNLPTFIRALGA